MNTRQMALRIKSLLRSRRWYGDPAGDRVFAPGSIRVTQQVENSAWDRLVLPAVFIRIGTGQADDQEPGSLNRFFDVVLVCSEPGGLFGEEALIGAHQNDDLGGRGRGLLELEDQLFAVLEELSAKDGVSVNYVADAAPVPDMDDDRGYMVAGAYRFRGLITTRATHLSLRSLAASEAAGTVTLTWAAPRDTTDLIEYVVVRAVGDLPAPRPSEGVEVYRGPALTVQDSPAPGDYTYSGFALYADPGGSVPLHYTDYDYDSVRVT